MSLLAYKKQHESGVLSKKNYMDEMYQLHLRLFEYCEFIKSTDIATIEIQRENIVFKLKNGIKLQCDIADQGAAPFSILIFNSYEKEELKMIVNLLESNSTFFDIGANIGFYSISIAHVYNDIKIYAFEPINKTFATLVNNTKLNNINNVTAFNVGFYDENKTLNFYFNPFHSGATSLRNLLKDANVNEVSCSVIRLDDFFQRENIAQVDFIKCDVEGAELLVLKGAVETLQKHKPIIFLEMLRKWSEKFNYHPNDIITFLKNRGYRCFVVKNEKLKEFLLMDENTIETNFFFLNESKHVAQLKKWVE